MQSTRDRLGLTKLKNKIKRGISPSLGSNTSKSSAESSTSAQPTSGHLSGSQAMPIVSSVRGKTADLPTNTSSRGSDISNAADVTRIIPLPTENSAAIPKVLITSSSTHFGLQQGGTVSSSIVTVSQSSATEPTSSESISDAHPLGTYRDLWAEALEELSLEEQSAVQQLTQEGTENQQPTTDRRSLSENMIELLKVTQGLKDRCDEKSWKPCFMGKEIIVRDVVGKVAIWLTKFKDFGDIAVNFDPIHGALPWAAFRFCLLAVTAENDQMVGLVLIIEKLSCLIARSAIYSSLYRPPVVPKNVLDSLNDSLIAMHIVLLRMMVLCHRLFTKNTIKRATHAFLNPTEVSEFLVKCEEAEKRVECDAQNCASARSGKADEESMKLLETMQAPILRIDERMGGLLEVLQDTERERILNWISTILPGDNHKLVKEQRTENTCEWLLDHSSFHQWQQESSSDILWLYGRPGSGKTFLTSKVIDKIQDTLLSQPNQEGLAFFYCNRNEEERRQPLTALRAFVRQLASTPGDDHSIQIQLKQFVEKARKSTSKPSLGDCKELLLACINIYPMTTLVLDALDECTDENQLVLINILEEVLNCAKKPVKIFISSRPDDYIKRELSTRSKIGIRASDNGSDISKYIDSRIAKHRGWSHLTAEFRRDIGQKLQEKSDGKFQWAFLQIEQLFKLDRSPKIISRLGKLPEGLQEAYREIFNNIPDDQVEFAHRAIKWVMCAKKPLKTSELLPAVVQDDNMSIGDDLTPLEEIDEDRLLKYCHHLLVIDPFRNVWIPSHLSVIEYFEKKEVWGQSQANCLVAKVCLLVLQNTTRYDRERYWITELKDRHYPPRTPLIDTERESKDPLGRQEFKYLSYYARHHWMLHAQNINEKNGSQAIAPLLESFLGMPAESSPAYQCWHRMISKNESFYPETSGFNGRFGIRDLTPDTLASFAFCSFGLDNILPNWHAFSWSDDNTRTKTGFSFLELASISGSVSLSQALIDHGAEVNAFTDSKTGSALTAASYFGSREIVKFLGQNGADVNLQVQNGRWGSALIAASYSGSREIVEFLVQNGADVNLQVQNGIWGSALIAASCFGRREIVEFLVQNGVDVSLQVQNGRWGSALIAASYSGSREIVEFLGQNGADVNLQVQNGIWGSALIAASCFGRRKIVEFLVQNGADVNLQVQNGRWGSALIAASCFGWRKIVEFLVQNVADVNMKVTHGAWRNALAAAAAEAGEGKRGEMRGWLIKLGAVDKD